MKLRVGSLVYACDSGLGRLAKDFHDHGVITHPFVVRHAHHPTHGDWYPGAPETPIRSPDMALIRGWLASLDVLLALETPFWWPLLDECRARGVKTALMPMIECMPRNFPTEPDMLLCPSALDFRHYPPTPTRPSAHLPVPVNVPWRRRERAEVFVHNAGHGGLRGRNGTAEVLEAWRHVRNPARLILRSQKPNGGGWPGVSDPRIDIRFGTVPYDGLWRDGGEGDVFLFPDRFQGLSLPLQEARAAGMLAMATRRFPHTEWLPHEPLIPPAGFRPFAISPRCEVVDEALVEPRAIARHVDDFYGRDISAYSEAGREWAEQNSWAALGPRYREALEGLL